ncbi:alkylmercury lyase family protein [Oscillochloris sp. ZM17-4]|uniref:organomercurial lyase n=1 Tax=Oscillochloris sp. ZM17-4 TaxID=2866714 RepID=UPI001C72BA10|nr:alkylmercury lyase family protein [Oscillochloris sp. ZM17-4]
MKHYEIDELVRCEVYTSFVDDGGPPDAEALAGRLGLSLGELHGSYERLADEQALVLDPRSRAIWMAIPFSAAPTPVRVRADDGRAWWANCAWDGLGIPAMLGIDATLETACPATGAPIAVRIYSGTPEPGPWALRMAVPLAKWWEDIGST